MWASSWQDAQASAAARAISTAWGRWQLPQSSVRCAASSRIGMRASAAVIAPGGAGSASQAATASGTISERPIFFSWRSGSRGLAMRRCPRMPCRPSARVPACGLWQSSQTDNGGASIQFASIAAGVAFLPAAVAWHAPQSTPAAAWPEPAQPSSAAASAERRLGRDRVVPSERRGGRLARGAVACRELVHRRSGEPGRLGVLDQEVLIRARGCRDSCGSPPSRRSRSRARRGSAGPAARPAPPRNGTRSRNPSPR